MTRPLAAIAESCCALLLCVFAPRKRFQPHVPFTSSTGGCAFGHVLQSRSAAPKLLGTRKQLLLATRIVSESYNVCKTKQRALAKVELWRLAITTLLFIIEPVSNSVTAIIFGWIKKFPSRARKEMLVSFIPFSGRDRERMRGDNLFYTTANKICSYRSTTFPG